MAKRDKYVAKGYITFAFYVEDDQAGLVSTTMTIEDKVQLAMWNCTPSAETEQIYRDMYTADFTHEIYHLMSGEHFLEAVLSGSITDYDGCISRVYVDGFESNLGLSTENLTDGQLLVNETAWKDLCKHHKVEVDWANK